jgi:predicted GIY-YIG superfamily endonuclease
MNKLAEVEHTVYRLYDRNNRLIYVGCTYNLEPRLKQHRKVMWWASQIAKIKTETHPSRKAGLAAERRIRDTEHPRWNIEARWMKRERWSYQMFNDYITALENHPMNRTAKWPARINAAKAFQMEKFGSRS